MRNKREKLRGADLRWAKGPGASYWHERWPQWASRREPSHAPCSLQHSLSTEQSQPPAGPATRRSGLRLVGHRPQYWWRWQEERGVQRERAREKLSLQQSKEIFSLREGERVKDIKSIKRPNWVWNLAKGYRLMSRYVGSNLCVRVNIKKNRNSM